MVKVCDVVTINAPVHPGTLDLFNDELIGKMKRGAYLVNTARGLICNREAVVHALESSQLAGYAGDVWYPQPAPKNHPWRTMPNHGMTPHILVHRSRLIGTEKCCLREVADLVPS
jgi:formate dehydrogenase